MSDEEEVSAFIERLKAIPDLKVVYLDAEGKPLHMCSREDCGHE